MANFVLQELPEEMSEGKKVVFPKMQTYSLHDYDTVIKNMRTYAGSISDGLIRAVFDALVSTMQSWMPLGHSIKRDSTHPRLRKKPSHRGCRKTRHPRQNTGMCVSTGSISSLTLNC